MKLKLNEDGNVVVQDGKPVYVQDDGKEVAFDAAGTIATIGRLNGEARSHREKAEQFEAKYKPFEGIEDPEAARKALDTVKNLDDKKLVDAGQIETIKSEITKTYEAKLAEKDSLNKKLEGDLYQEKVGGSFARSKFISEECAVPPDMIEARFGKNFKVEDGRTVGYDQHGNKLYSQSNPGETADFDEALSMLVSQYSYKDQILKGSQASGAGVGAQQGGGSGQKTLKRAEFEGKAPAEQAAFFKEGGTVTD